MNTNNNYRHLSIPIIFVTGAIVFPILRFGEYTQVQALESQLKAAQSWPQAAGTVVDFQSSNTATRGESLVAKAQYRYAVKGSQKSGEQTKFLDYEFDSFGGGQPHYSHKQMEKLAGDFSKGKSVKVRYDPKNPSDSYLDAETRYGASAFLMSKALMYLVYLAVGGIVLIVMRIPRR